MKPIIHFAHGKESGPWGSKISHLAQIARNHGCDVESLDYSGILDPSARADKLVAACANETRRLILVGSSMGGWVVTEASQQLKPVGLFLLAPAFYLPGYPETSPACAPGNIEVVHGWRDEVILFEHSIRFGRHHACTVHLVDDDHRLSEKLDDVAGYFALFLERIFPA
jgi:predicted esterase